MASIAPRLGHGRVRRGAQAAREKKAARIILGKAEVAIAHSFSEAAKEYHNNPTALHLRAMNMLSRRTNG